MQQHRFYKNEFPEVDEIVMIKVKEITDIGVYVSLIEYGSLEGMILLSELSKRRIRSIRKLVREGLIFPVMVLRVDEERGHVDLSRKRLTDDDIKLGKSKYGDALAINSIMKQVSRLSNMDIGYLYEIIVWVLSEKYENVYNIFRSSINETNDILDKDIQISSELKIILMEVLIQKIKHSNNKIRSDIEIKCFGYDGIDVIREAILIGMETPGLTISLIASPKYVMILSSLDILEGIKIMNNSIEKMSLYLNQIDGGSLNVLETPHVQTSEENDELNKILINE